MAGASRKGMWFCVMWPLHHAVQYECWFCLRGNQGWAEKFVDTKICFVRWFQDNGFIQKLCRLIVRLCQRFE